MAFLLATAVLWVIVLLIHVLSCAFYVAVAYVYHKLPSTVLSADLRAFQLTMDMTQFPIVVIFHSICAVVHLAYFFEMTIQSARHRKLYFKSSRVSNRTAPAPAREHGPSLTEAQNAASKVESGRAVSFVAGSLHKTNSVWKSSFGYTGFFGVHGKHFTLIFLVREVTETILQSIQAYNLSHFVPRVWLNRLAVASVTLSCWSTPVIRRLFHNKPRLELLLCLLFDVTLDFVSSVGVPTGLATLYWPDYDTELTNFEISRWYDLSWYAHMTNEFRLLFIQNWYDFGSRALFAVTLLLCLDDVKFLAADSNIVIIRPPRVDTESRRVTWNRRIETLAHVALVAWGCLILGLHSDAAFDTHSADCAVQVRPWLTTKSACAYLAVDCLQHEGMVGTVAQVEAIWSDLDSQFLSFLSFTNCPQLSVPPSLQSFTNMVGLYVINVVLEDWPEEAALTKQHHPSLHHLAIVTVDFARYGNGTSLPAGLVSRDFPPTLRLIFISSCKLTHLPDDLHLSWPPGVNLILAVNAFTKLPDVLLRMNLMRLIISVNPITELPAALFEIPSLYQVELMGVPITQFPPEVSSLSPALRGILFQYTQVTSLPAWMLTDKFTSQVQASGGGTPYCTQLQSKTQDAESARLASRYCSLT